MSIFPSPGVSLMPRTAAGVGAGVGVGGTGVGATVKVHVASWSATPTALPASAAVWNVTCGHSNVAPVTQAGMLWMTRRFSRPAVSAPRSFGSRPMPTGRRANDGRLAEQLISRRDHLASRHALDIVAAIGEQDQRGPFRVGGEVLGRLLHRGDVVRVGADRAVDRSFSIRAGHRAEAIRKDRDIRGAAQELEVPAAAHIDRMGREFDQCDRGVAPDEVRRSLVDAVRDALERGSEPVAVRLVVQDRRREIEDEGDVRLVGALCGDIRHEAAKPDDCGSDEHGDGSRA